MPKRKTTPDAVDSAAPAAESTAMPRKSAAKPKAATTAASHRHTRKPAQTSEVEMEAPAVVAAVVNPVQESVQEPVRVVTHEEIARVAYSYWAARGYQGGSPEEDWLRAERELAILS